MDATNTDVYDRHGADFAQRYRSSQRVSTERFEQAFAHGRRVLEIGVGSGIDPARLFDAGYDAVGIELSATLRGEAVESEDDQSNRSGLQWTTYLAEKPNFARPE